MVILLQAWVSSSVVRETGPEFGWNYAARRTPVPIYVNSA